MIALLIVAVMKIVKIKINLFFKYVQYIVFEYALYENKF